MSAIKLSTQLRLDFNIKHAHSNDSLFFFLILTHSSCFLHSSTRKNLPLPVLWQRTTSFFIHWIFTLQAPIELFLIKNFATSIAISTDCNLVFSFLDLDLFNSKKNKMKWKSNLISHNQSNLFGEKKT
jgi:hypothetical protein